MCAKLLELPRVCACTEYAQFLSPGRRIDIPAVSYTAGSNNCMKNHEAWCQAELLTIRWYLCGLCVIFLEVMYAEPIRTLDCPAHAIVEGFLVL